MQVTFLDHSGFLVELDSTALLFDWWKGELPAIRPGVPLYVFASHVHPDHFDPRIFTLDDGSREVRFILGHDIKRSSRNLSRWGASPETAEKCRNLRGGGGFHRYHRLVKPEGRLQRLLGSNKCFT